MVIAVGFPGGICNTTAKIQLACNYGAGSESSSTSHNVWLQLVGALWLCSPSRSILGSGDQVAGVGQSCRDSPTPPGRQRPPKNSFPQRDGKKECALMHSSPLSTCGYIWSRIPSHSLLWQNPILQKKPSVPLM